LIRACAWCNKEIGSKEPLEDNSITHTICEECRKRIEKERDNIYTRVVESENLALHRPPCEGFGEETRYRSSEKLLVLRRIFNIEGRQEAEEKITHSNHSNFYPSFGNYRLSIFLKIKLDTFFRIVKNAWLRLRPLS